MLSFLKASETFEWNSPIPFGQNISRICTEPFWKAVCTLQYGTVGSWRFSKEIRRNAGNRPTYGKKGIPSICHILYLDRSFLSWLLLFKKSLKNRHSLKSHLISRTHKKLQKLRAGTDRKTKAEEGTMHVSLTIWSQ